MVFLGILCSVASGLGIIYIGRRLRPREFAFAAYQWRYQGLSLAAGLLAWVVTGLTGTWVSFVGDFAAPVANLEWLGVSKADTWQSFGATIGVIMASGTLLVVWLQSGRGSGIHVGHLLSALPLVLLFSAANALTEELIFRAALVQSMQSSVAPWGIALASALWFGGLHYFGNPGKIPGVLMAGFMAWLLTFSVVQTQGLFWAWFIHFVQDVVILAILFAGEKAREQK